MKNKNNHAILSGTSELDSGHAILSGTSELDSGHAILIGAGELDSSHAILMQQEKQKGAYVIALDGGLVFCAEHNIEPDMIVGDFDSLKQKLSEEECEGELEIQKVLAKYPTEIIHRLPCEKDDTDTLVAIKMAIEKGFTRFTIYGGLGGRLSHTMANMQSLLYLKEQGLYGELIGDGSKVFLIKNESITLQPTLCENGCADLQMSALTKPQKQGYLSIFACSEKAQGVTLRNLKYEVENAELMNSFPIGVSNEFIGKEAVISVKKGALLIIVEG